MVSKIASTVRVSNLPSDTSQGELERYFHSQQLSVASSSLCPCSDRPKSTLVATLTFYSPNLADKALLLTGCSFRGQKIEIDRGFHGLTVLAAPAKPRVDIITLHGLNGHAFGTWTYRHLQGDKSEVTWIRDFLPEALPDARVLTYGYNSLLTGDTSVSTVQDFAYDLLQRLVEDRSTQSSIKRPLIFLCHSLGGIVAKQALVAAMTDQYRYPDIAQAVTSVIFLGTPHCGSASASKGLLVVPLATLAGQTPATQLLHTLRRGSATLMKLSEEFRRHFRNLKIVSFYERKKIPLIQDLIVDRDSATVGVQDELLIPMNATHSEICKFSGVSNELYVVALAQIRNCYEHALGQQGFGELAEAVTETPSEYPVICSVPYPRNLQFLGRDDELCYLQNAFAIGDKGTNIGHRIVAIHGLGGVGKTQLVTEFVYQLRDQSPRTAVLWLMATNEREIRSSCTTLLEMLVSLGFLKLPGDNEVEAVNSWMVKQAHNSWILVLDSLDDHSMVPIIRKLLPAQVTGRIIITSRDRRIATSLATSEVHLGEMSARSAECLFLQKSRINSSNDTAWQQPDKHSEYSYIKAIVEELAYFPLAIDQAAAFIRENSPLTFEEYRQYLRPRTEDRELLLRFKEANPEYPESIMTTWEISFQALEKVHPRASWLLQLCGFLEHSYIPEKLLLQASKPVKWIFASNGAERELGKTFSFAKYLETGVGFRQAIGLLISLSLVQRLGGPEFHLYMHPLVHEWIRVRLNTSLPIKEEFSITALLVIYQTFPLETVSGLDRAILNQHRSDLADRERIVMKHIVPVLLNFRECATRNHEVPLECFTLTSSMLLYPYVMSIRLRYDVVHHLRLSSEHIQQRLPHEYKAIARFIQRGIGWLTNPTRKGGIIDSQRRILKSMESLSLRVSSDAALAPCLALLITVVASIANEKPRGRTDDVTAITAMSISRVEMFRTGNQGLEERHVSTESRRETERERSSLALYKQLDHLLHQLEEPNTIVLQLINTVQHEVFCRMKPIEFSVYSLFDANGISIESLSHWSYELQSNYLSRLLQLFWLGEVGNRDIAGIGRVYYVMQKLIESHLAEIEHASAGIRMAHAIEESTSSMKQLAQGYTGQFSTMGSSRPYASLKEHLNFKTFDNLNFFSSTSLLWEKLPEVALAISDPSTRWKPSQGTVAPRILSLVERQQGLKLLTRFRSLHAAIIHYSGVSARYLIEKEILPSSSVLNLYAARISFKLGDRSGLYNAIAQLYSHSAFTKKCDSLPIKPWDLAIKEKETSDGKETDKWSRIKACHDQKSAGYEDVEVTAELFLDMHGLDDSCGIVTDKVIFDLIDLLLEILKDEVVDKVQELKEYKSRAMFSRDQVAVRWLALLEIVYRLSQCFGRLQQQWQVSGEISSFDINDQRANSLDKVWDSEGEDDDDNEEW